MNNINTHKLYYLVNIYNHTLNKKVFLNEIAHITEILKQLQNNLSKKGESINVLG